MMGTEVRSIPLKINQSRKALRYIILKMIKFKDRDRILNTARSKKGLPYKEVKIRCTADLSNET